MNRKIIVVAPLLAGLILMGTSLSVSAQTTSTRPNVAARQAARLENIVNRANQEISRRVSALQALANRVTAMAKLSSDQKQGLSSTIQSQIQAMQSLQSQIQTDAGNLTALKADVQSIAKTYRIYMLVIPQGAIEAAADRAMDVASTLQTLAAKLQTRIAGLPASSANLTDVQNALMDMNAKISDANVQAQAAVSEVSGLKPDNGDQAQMQTNTAALKDARSKIQAVQKDLVAARQDAGTIVKDLKGVSSGTGSGVTTTSPSAE